MYAETGTQTDNDAATEPPPTVCEPTPIAVATPDTQCNAAQCRDDAVIGDAIYDDEPFAVMDPPPPPPSEVPEPLEPPCPVRTLDDYSLFSGLSNIPDVCLRRFRLRELLAE